LRGVCITYAIMSKRL